MSERKTYVKPEVLDRNVTPYLNSGSWYARKKFGGSSVESLTVQGCSYRCATVSLKNQFGRLEKSGMLPALRSGFTLKELNDMLR